MVLAVCLVVEGWNYAELRKGAESTENILRQKIVEVENLKGELVELQSSLAELKSEKLAEMSKDIKAKKTKNQKSPLWFDVNVLTPKEQIEKIDAVLKAK